jgi:uncharacterized caspase-like protein
MADRRAVVIGINEYKDSSLTLSGAVNDATEMREKLTTFGNFEILDDHFLINKSATAENIRRAVSDLLWRDDACSLSLFYFSGHGLHDGYGNGFIAPYDISKDEPLVCGIRMQELTQLLLAAKNKKAALAILDCCYSGVAADAAKGGLDPQGSPPLDEWFKALKADGVGEGRVVMASSGKDQKSRERSCTHEYGDRGAHDHGSFTFQLLEGIDGKATDTNGAVTLSQLVDFLNRQMQNDPFHKMSFFGSSLSQAQQIILAQPCQWTSDEQTMNRVDVQLTRPDPLQVLAAAVDVRKVLERSPRLQRACNLEKQIDARLKDYSDPAIQWLSDRMIDLIDFQVVTDNLRRLALSLKAATFAAQKRNLQGLMIGLCRASQKAAPGSDDTYLSDEEFKGMLRAYAASERELSGVAKSPTDGQKLAARDSGTLNK